MPDAPAQFRKCPLMLLPRVCDGSSVPHPLRLGSRGFPDSVFRPCLGFRRFPSAKGPSLHRIRRDSRRLVRQPVHHYGHVRTSLRILPTASAPAFPSRSPHIRSRVRRLSTPAGVSLFTIAATLPTALTPGDRAETSPGPGKGFTYAPPPGFFAAEPVRSSPSRPDRCRLRPYQRYGGVDTLAGWLNVKETDFDPSLAAKKRGLIEQGGKGAKELFEDERQDCENEPVRTCPPSHVPRALMPCF